MKEFSQLKPEDSFSPEDRRRIDEFWATVSLIISDAYPRDTEYAVMHPDGLRDHLKDEEVLSIINARSEDECVRTLPSIFTNGSVFAREYSSAIIATWKRVSNIV